VALNYPPHALVELSGTLVGSGTGVFDEQFSCGLRVVSDANGWLDFPDEAATAFAAKFAAWWPLSAAQMSTQAKLTAVKVNNIKPDGKYKDAVTWSASVASVAGFVAPNALPAFVCVAYTWTTAVSRGSAARGRNYLPNAWTTVGGGSVITTTTQNLMVTAAKGFLDCIRTAVTPLNGNIHPAIVSPGGKVVPPGMQRITGVRVGRTIDVQRRRKAQVPESYASSVWP
jgi:hypothetical protein